VTPTTHAHKIGLTTST